MTKAEWGKKADATHRERELLKIALLGNHREGWVSLVHSADVRNPGKNLGKRKNVL